MIGAAAIGVDTIQVSVSKRQLQRAADSAALAGAHALLQNDPIRPAVRYDLSLNDDVALSASPVIENAPTVGAYAGNLRAVRVVLAAERSVPFISFFTRSTMGITAAATAAIVRQSEYCMVSLERANETGIIFTGNSSLSLGCGVVSNSPSALAIQAPGSSTVVANPVAAVGGIPPSSNYAPGTRLLPSSPALEDPFARLPTPTVPIDCQPKYFQNTGAVPVPFVPTQSGVYCYRGMEIKGTVRLPNNAVIVIDGDELNFGSQANVTGNNVTFILTSREASTRPSSVAGITMNAGAILDLTAPTRGPYAGVLFYQDRRAAYGESVINGNSSSRFTGGFYFPNRKLVFNGNSGLSTECVQMVARRLTFSGNVRVQNSCPGQNGAQAFAATVVRLVG